jgi:hypothetical protein
LNTCYTNWLLFVMRELRQGSNMPKLITTYLTSSIKSEKFLKQQNERFIMFLQFISYISSVRTLKSPIKDTVYYKITLSPKDFLLFIGIHYSQYQLEKVLNFFKSLQTLEPLLKNFVDSSFISWVILPYLKIEKKVDLG